MLINELKALRTTLLLMIIGLLCVFNAHAINVGDSIRMGELVTVDGQTLSAEDLKGKYLAVQVWATWCPYCHRQNANLKELVKRTQGSNLQVIGLSIDKSAEVVKTYAAKYEINFPLVMMTPELSQQIGKRRGVPELYVIDPTGKVIQKDFGQMVDLDIFDLARFGRRAPVQP
ncbi:TlpA disulfide reductase family protein [Zwartia sp.]|uniref:TlpA disulfide reductase family protein n=1 Tax=Zwartia sp. TaxID=2978004 RepID=UPI0027205049|nr:TlpA disulfide reductase family protein [Zwartia sp.]MDO9024914.1 TlpA disulfide reductase family protein [Zwartia sp.]